MKRTIAATLSAAMVVSMSTSSYAQTNLGKVCWSIVGVGGVYPGATLALQVLNYKTEIFPVNGYIQLTPAMVPGCLGRRQIPVSGTAVVNAALSPASVILEFESGATVGPGDSLCQPINWEVNLDINTLNTIGNGDLLTDTGSGGPFTLVLLSPCPALIP